MMEHAACETCGHASTPGMRFCTACGAPRADAESSAPETTAAEAPAAAPTVPERPRWALDTPPANESWWRNPVVVAIAVVTLLLGGGGVASWRLFWSASATESALHALPQSNAAPAHDTTATTSTAGTGTEQESTLVGEVGSILRRSAAGRSAALRDRDYGAALRNRRSLIAALDRLVVPAQSAGLVRALGTLRTALEASARADAQHLACGCDTELPDDVAASRLKRRFALLFDPYARRYAVSPVDPARI